MYFKKGNNYRDKGYNNYLNKWVKISPAKARAWLKGFTVPKILNEVDCVISIPGIKTHSIAAFPMAIKNWVGIKGLGKKMPRYLLKCGCCDEKLEIYYDTEGLEINGVNGSIEDWREILFPLLKIREVQ